MSEHPNNLKDQELDEYLAGRHPLSARYRAEAGDADAGPSAELDAAILGEARQAVSAEQPYPQPRWFRPLAAAALVVLCVGLVMQVYLETPQEDNAAVTPAQELYRDAAPATQEHAEQAAKARARAQERRKAAEPSRPRALLAPARNETATTGAARPDEHHQPPAPAPTPAPVPMAAPAEAQSATQYDAMPTNDAVEESRQAKPGTEHSEVFTEIRALLEDGEEAAARERLAAWREMHPDTALPEDLRHLEAGPETPAE